MRAARRDRDGARLRARQVLLADEPTTALDVMVQAQILRLLVSLTEELGLALIFVSHDLPAVAQVTDSIAVMYAGRIVEEAATNVLFADPQPPLHPDARRSDARPVSARITQFVSIPGAPPRLDRRSPAARSRHAAGVSRSLRDRAPADVTAGPRIGGRRPPASPAQDTLHATDGRPRRRR